ncbi:hypothetical protein TUM16655_44770 [Enterobacter cloacae]|nr:hypothetical protein TUM16655_44770 [Enterobacter cloacae]
MTVAVNMPKSIACDTSGSPDHILSLLNSRNENTALSPTRDNNCRINPGLRVVRILPSRYPYPTAITVTTTNILKK